MNNIKNKILPKNFYLQTDNNEISKKLIGKALIRLTPYPIGGIIVETESYPGGKDKASHHWGDKKTDRTKTIFNSQKGKLYVYMTYGLHYCFGITSGNGNINNVTCIRALEPIIGIKQMMRNRNQNNITNLLNGPAKVAQALKITKDEDNIDLCKSDIIVCDLNYRNFEIETSPRVGIKDFGDGYRQKQWRFFIKGNKYISK